MIGARFLSSDRVKGDASTHDTDVDDLDEPSGGSPKRHAKATRLEREQCMGIYLEIARRAVEGHRREEAERLARERREKIAKVEEVIIRVYSAKLKNGADNHEDLVEDLALWNPHFTAERDVIEEAVRTASKKVAKSRDFHDTIDCPVHQELHEGSVDRIHPGDDRVERHGAGADVDEIAEPEIDAEGLSGESVDPDAHLGAEVEMDQVTRVAEVLRQHWAKRLAEADDLVEEGFFHDKLDFAPTTGIVEQAQCMLLLPEE